MSTVRYNFKVELYQINCSQDGVGEAAIMLVLRNMEGTAKYEIAYSILIDCGLYTNAAARVFETIECIKAKYPGDFKFDAVVISHWDRDHYRGFVEFMNSVQTKWDKDKSGTDKCNWFRYDDDGNPMTYFYGQEWHPKINDAFALDKAKTFEDDDTVSMSFKPKKGTRKNNVWRGRFTTDTVLGTNLIRNKTLQSDHPRTSITDLDRLLDANSPWSSTDCAKLQGLPGLYAVGVNNQILGKSGYTVVNEPFNSKAQANYDSILLLLAWKTDTESIASLYSGGDAEWQQEEALGHWLDGTQVSVVKAGHHGSRAGTSTKFMFSARPDYFLISAGRQYGHPVPELIFYLNAWFSHWERADPKTWRRIYSTCFPFHMGICGDDGKIRHFISQFQQARFVRWDRFIENSENPDEVKVYQAALSSLDPTSLRNLRQNLEKQKSDDSRRIILTKALREHWAKWSDISHHYYPYRGSDLEAYGRPGSSRSLLAILVTITPEPDGITFSKEGEPTPGVPKRKATESPGGEIHSKKSRTRLDKWLNLDVESGDQPGREIIACVEPEADEVIWPVPGVREILQKDEEEEDSAVLKSELRKGHIAAAEDKAREDSDLVSNQYPFQFKAVCSSTFPGSPASGCLTLQEDSNLDFFLRQTETCRLQLSDIISLAAENAPWKATVSPTDDLAQWWCEAFLDYGLASSSFELGATGNEIDMFKITRLLFEKTSTPLKLVYSSDLSTLETAFQVPKTRLSSKLDNNGIQHGTYNLILGLDVKSCENVDTIISLDSLCALFEFRTPKWLDQKMQLKLQTQSTNTDEAGNLPIINAIWLMPGYNYQTTWRLHSVEAAAQSDLKSKLLSQLLPGWTIDSVKFVFTKTLSLSTQEEISIKSTLTIHARVQLDAGTNGYWDAYISLYDTSAEVTLRWNGTLSPMESFLKWMGKQSSSALLPFNTFRNRLDQLSGSAQNGSDYYLRQVWFGIDLPTGASGSSTNSHSISSLALDFELDLTWKPSTQPLAFLMTFTWDKWPGSSNPLFKLVGSMWPSPIEEQDMDPSKLMDAYKLNPDPPVPPPLTPISSDYAKTVSLDSLPGMGQLASALPQEIHVELSGLNVEITSDQVSFSGVIVVNSGRDDASHTFPLADLNLNFVWKFDDSTNLSSSLSFDAIVPLAANPGMKITSNGDDDDNDPLPLCICSVDYISGHWVLSATVEDLSGGNLYSLLPRNGDAETVSKLLGEVYIPRLNITYTYDRTPGSTTGDTFKADGLLRLGRNVDLALTFNLNNSKSPSWEFYADFSYHGNTGKATTSVGDLVSSFSLDLQYLFPQFLLELELDVDEDTKIDLKCFKTDGGNPYTVLGISAEFNGLQFSFVQILKKGDTNPPKRMLRFTVDTLPAVQTIPLVNKLPQPFDEMDFLWLSSDFSEKEVALLNTEFFTKDPLLFVDPTKQVTSEPKRRGATAGVDGLQADAVDPIVLTAGSHFQIVNSNSFGTPDLILDYDFHAKSRPKDDEKLSVSSSDNDIEDNKAKSAPFCVKRGPLSISGLGLAYKDGKVVISLDASISIGPVTGTLNSFSLSVPVNKLTKLGISDMIVSIQGIGLSFDEHPVSMSGLLIKEDDGSWAGGVSIDYEPYAFMAGGMYKSVQRPGTAATVFVFARLDGPLVELEFATISKITGGFGYNNAMTLPNVSNVTQFPFLQGDLGDKPLAVLDKFLNPSPITWFSLAEGQFWLAAGLTCTAFQVLDIQAVATVSWGSEGTKLGIFADCVAKCPLAAKNDDELFLLMDLGIIAIVDPGKGIFHCEGELQPNSFVLNRSCHLHGGFALCYWFQGSGHEGDWVFTVGGYHSSFKPPPHYPIPSRLGISWDFDSSISISGEAYFAITPKACMGGGKLQVTFQDGLLHAYFDAWADFLINYRPFSFVGDIGVSVGIGFTIHIWFFTINFNVHFGAAVHLHGPPMAGYVFVDWDIISFTIHFGDSDPKNNPLTWDETWALLKQIDSSAGGGGRDKDAVHVLAATGGLTHSQADTVKITAETTDKWDVSGGKFEFTVKALFPITRFTYQYSEDETLVYDFGGPATFIKPMHITSNDKVTSELYIEIRSDEGLLPWFPAEPITEYVPTALWGAYDPNQDPNAGQAATELLKASNSTVSQLMGIRLRTPPPKLSYDNMCPFPVQDVCSFFVFDETAGEKTPKIPTPTTPSLENTWFPDPDTQKQQHADADLAKKEWAKPDTFLSTWTSIMGERSEIPCTNVDKMYDKFNKTAPKRVFEKWNECFPLSPLVSVGSA